MDIQTAQNLIIKHAEAYLTQAEYYTDENYKLVRQSFDQFIENLETSGCANDEIDDARFFICAYLDEISTWSHSLLKHFYGLTDSHQKNLFFERLEERQKNPEKNIDLLELAYICLSLGYRGRYKEKSDDEAIIQLMDRLFADIRHFRGEPTEQLTLVKQKEESHWRLPPIWFTVILGIIILAAIYIPYNDKLNAYTKPVIQAIKNLAADAKTNDS